MSKTFEMLEKHPSFGGPDQPLSYMAETVNRMVNELNDKKEKILRDKIEEMGLTHLLETFNHRFPRICIVHSVDNSTETYYADNGTIEGLRIITFTQVVGDGIKQNETDKYFNLKTTLNFH